MEFETVHSQVSESTVTQVTAGEGDEDVYSGLTVINLIMILLGLLGIMSNGLVLLVMGRQKQPAVSSILVINQSAVDLTCSLFFIVTYSYWAKPLSTYSGYGREAICYLVVSEILVYNTMNASTFSLLVITFE